MDIEIGDFVFVRVLRSPTGAQHCRGDKNLPLTKCRVSQKGICGVDRAYGLEFMDGKAVGIPFFIGAFEKALKADPKCGSCGKSIISSGLDCPEDHDYLISVAEKHGHDMR